MQPRQFLPSVPAAILAAFSFGIWAVYSALPAVTGRPGIREAWDSDAYWTQGVPLLLAAVAAAGCLGKDKPWAIAAWTVIGHFVGILTIRKAGSDLGLLPLALVFIGAPAFGIFTGLAWLADLVRRVLLPPSAGNSE